MNCSGNGNKPGSGNKKEKRIVRAGYGNEIDF